MAILWGVLGFVFGSVTLALVRAAQWEKVDKEIDKALSRLDVNVPWFFDTYKKLDRLNEEIIQIKLVLEELQSDLKQCQDISKQRQTLIDAWKRKFEDEKKRNFEMLKSIKEALELYSATE